MKSSLSVLLAGFLMSQISPLEPAASQQAFSIYQAPASMLPARMLPNPIWLHRPTAADLMKLYPDRALHMQVSGKVTLVCTVLAEGLLSHCFPTFEQPEGWGFMGAASRATRTELFQLQLHNPGEIGAGVAVPFTFAAAGASLIEAPQRPSP